MMWLDKMSDRGFAAALFATTPVLGPFGWVAAESLLGFVVPILGGLLVLASSDRQ